MTPAPVSPAAFCWRRSGATPKAAPRRDCLLLDVEISVVAFPIPGPALIGQSGGEILAGVIAADGDVAGPAIAAVHQASDRAIGDEGGEGVRRFLCARR